MTEVTLESLASDPHPALARLRRASPVAWLEDLGGWLVTGHGLAQRVLTDWQTFTVDDERFSTARVVGPSMLSLDGPRHTAHRSAFAPDLRRRAVYGRLKRRIEDSARSLVRLLAGTDSGDLRAAVATPLATEVMRDVLGLGELAVDQLTEWNESITAAIDEVTIGSAVPEYGVEAFEALRSAVSASMASGGALAGAADRGPLSLDEVAANVAVLLIGGIVTADGAVSIALRHLLDRPDLDGAIRDHPELVDRFVDESMRLEPAAAFVDRYATSEALLGPKRIQRGELVRVSISGANRDPDVFAQPDGFDLGRGNAADHLAFARGPHACLGIHVARLETRIAITTILEHLPGLRAAPGGIPGPHGLIFRAPERVPAVWGGDSITLS